MTQKPHTANPLFLSPLAPLAPVASAHRHGMSLYRCQKLAYNLRGAAIRLSGTHPHDVPSDHLDDYLRLGWLRWEPQSLRLRLTADGAAVCATPA